MGNGEIMSFGDISRFYSVLKLKDKKIDGYSNISPLDLNRLYHSAAYLRNLCCHFTRLY
ncbi:Abi family protein [Anaerorhabdus furcosa]|uniref:Abi family protein n=1 Tax=Anaerorhabdus furcosa TaxID=118967 RepID=UPI00099A7737